MSASNNANASINANAESSGLAGDLIWGVDAIAAELNLTRRQTYHQLAHRIHDGRWLASPLGAE
jgi:hypothetical protein